MTAIAFAPARAECGQSSPLKRLVLAVLFGLVIVLALRVLTQHHAVIKHGDEARAIRNCLKNNGPQFTWRSLAEPDVYYLTCQLPDGRWGFQVVKWDRLLRKLVERTAFVKGDGSQSVLWQYLQRFAVRYMGALPQ